MLSFWLGVYYGCVLGFLSATCYRHWASLYEPRTFIHEENGASKQNAKYGPLRPWRPDGGP